jgi:hypothetical protein
MIGVLFFEKLPLEFFLLSISHKMNLSATILMAVLMAVLIFQMCTYLCSNISIQNQKYKKNVSISFCKQLRTIFLHDKLLHM